MAALANERIAWFNGRFMPEREVLVPFRDRGFLYGDAVFDTTRSFGHRLFKVEAHIERLYRSLRYVRIDPGIARASLRASRRRCSSATGICWMAMRTIG
jgi:branched-chain amino acid aminotransferase